MTSLVPRIRSKGGSALRDARRSAQVARICRKRPRAGTFPLKAAGLRKAGGVTFPRHDSLKGKGRALGSPIQTFTKLSFFVVQTTIKKQWDLYNHHRFPKDCHHPNWINHSFKRGNLGLISHQVSTRVQRLVHLVLYFQKGFRKGLRLSRCVLWIGPVKRWQAADVAIPKYYTSRSQAS